MSDGWQPIESAPKDGTKILVWTIHGDIEITEWFEQKHFVYDDIGDGKFTRRETIAYEGWNGNWPTFWQPLPSPPKD